MHCESISLFTRTHSVTVFPPEIFRACAIPLHHCENKIPPCMIMHLHSEPKSTHTHMHTTTHTYICTLIPTHQQQQRIPSVLLLSPLAFVPLAVVTKLCSNLVRDLGDCHVSLAVGRKVRDRRKEKDILWHVTSIIPSVRHSACDSR